MNLTSIHVTAALLLTEGQLTDAQVGKKIHRAARTLRMWKKDSDFAALLSKVGDETVNAATRYQRAQTLAAAQIVVKLMDKGGEHDTVRLRAAQDVLDRVLGKAAQRQIIMGDPDAPVAVVAGPRKKVKA